MTKSTVFDLFIVYSQRLAESPVTDVLKPFPKGSSCESYNNVYSYFLEICRKNGLKAAFTTSADIVGPGLCRGYWLFQNDQWLKVSQKGYAKLIFDKFSPVNRQIKTKRALLFSLAKVRPFNNPKLFELFFDKQKSYKKLSKFSIPTVSIEKKTQVGFLNAYKSLQRIIARHPDKADFSDELIVKDRFGAGGLNVFKFNANELEKITTSINKCSRKSFIIQPFVKFDRGLSYLGVPVSADIRLIYLGGKIVQTYLRMAKTGDFRCNEHQGGLLKYIAKKNIHQAVTKVADQVAKKLNQKRSLFALDFIISNYGNVYLLEGNTGPGLDWNLSIKENELESKKLIRLVVKEIANRTVKRKGDRKIEQILPKTDEYSEITGLPIAAVI